MLPIQIFPLCTGNSSWNCHIGCPTDSEQNTSTVPSHDHLLGQYPDLNSIYWQWWKIAWRTWPATWNKWGHSKKCIWEASPTVKFLGFLVDSCRMSTTLPNKVAKVKMESHSMLHSDTVSIYQFAARHNTQLQRLFSFTLDPKMEAIDDLAQDLSHL